jgi:hypothetical protein
MPRRSIASLSMPPALVPAVSRRLEPPATLPDAHQRLIASCLNDACRHTALIEVWSYPAETEIPYFRSRVACAKCGSRGNKIDVRPNWKEQPTR